MDPTVVIRTMLAPLAEYYEHDEHEEIAVNQPGEVWCRRHKPNAEGNIWVRYADDRLTLNYLSIMARAVANAYGHPYDPNDPSKPCTIFESLPPSEHRLAAIVGRHVVYEQSLPEGGFAMCIRKGANAARTHRVEYSDWGLNEGEGVKEGFHDFKEITSGKIDAVRALREAVQAGHNILISGGTSTGKTTLFNRVIEEMDPRTRIITVEDTREIRLPKNKNHVHLLLSRTDKKATFTYDNAIDVIMRFTPDVVLVGEISTSNAGALWKLTGTGHGAMMTTIHASSVEECYSLLVERIAGCLPTIDRKELADSIRKRFVIIQMGRTLDGKRVVTDIETPPRPDHGPAQAKRPTKAK